MVKIRISLSRASYALIALILSSGLLVQPASAEGGKTIIIDGHVYELDLAENSELTRKLTSNQMPAEAGSHFRGRVKNHPDAWVRVSQVNGAWRGVVSLGGTLFVVDETSDSGIPVQSGAALAQLADLSATVIDEFEPQSCGVPTVNQTIGEECAQYRWDCG